MIKKITTGFALITSTLLFSQVGIGTPTPQATLDVTGMPTNTTKLDGIIAPRLTGVQLHGKTYTTAQTGALVYVTAADTAPANQTIDVTEIGYYYFNGTKWVATTKDTNIYNSDGALSDYRRLNFNGNSLSFEGNEQQTNFSDNGLSQIGLTDYARIQVNSADVNANGLSTYLTLHTFSDNYAEISTSGDSNGLMITANGDVNPSVLEFRTSPGGGIPSMQRLYITGDGNIGINTDNATEKFDNNGGNTRLRYLPANGATNAISTTPSGSPSSSQDQTFTATRTVVADANGVLGYVNGVPSEAGTQKVLVNANVSGTQNISGGTSVVGQFTVENIDLMNAWTSNVFTVPSGAGGLYMINMQTSNNHVIPDNSATSWFVMSYFQKSTDGGANWNIILRDTRSNMSSTTVDNGNALLWTGTLNAGDKIRPMFLCTATTNNTMVHGSLSITRIFQ
ncbi:hypothetical protein [Chryseobacterium wanjuense]